MTSTNSIRIQMDSEGEYSCNDEEKQLANCIISWEETVLFVLVSMCSGVVGEWNGSLSCQPFVVVVCAA